MAARHQEIVGWVVVISGLVNEIAARPTCGNDIPKPKSSLV